MSALPPNVSLLQMLRHTIWCDVQCSKAVTGNAEPSQHESGYSFDPLMGQSWHAVGEQVLCDMQHAKALSIDAEPRHHKSGHFFDPLIRQSWYAMGEQVLFAGCLEGGRAPCLSFT